MNNSQSDRRHKKFREGWENVTDDARSGRAATSCGDATVARVRELLNANRRMSVFVTLHIKHLKKCYSQIVANEIQMRKVCAKLVRKVLTRSGLQRFHH